MFQVCITLSFLLPLSNPRLKQNSQNHGYKNIIFIQLRTIKGTRRKHQVEYQRLFGKRETKKTSIILSGGKNRNLCS